MLSAEQTDQNVVFMVLGFPFVCVTNGPARGKEGGGREGGRGGGRMNDFRQTTVPK